jgi:PKD repeat protein
VKLESTGIPEIDEIEIQDVNACVGNLGAITVVPTEMNQDYEYSIDGGLTWSPDSIFTSLEVGFYDVQMKLPDNECINNLSSLIEIDTAEALDAQISIVSALTCSSSFDGILELSVFKGTPPYKILWSNGDTTMEAMNLNSGIYTVTIEDSNQCSQILELELSGFETDSLLLNFEDVIKCKDEIVRFEVDSNYTYEIYKEGQFYFERSQIEIGEEGQYEVIVDLGGACKSSSSFTIENLDLEGSGIDFLLSTEGVKGVEVYGVNVSSLQGSSFEWEVKGSAVEVDSIDTYTQGFTFRDTGVYQVSLTGTFNNCQVTLEKSIIIYPDSTFLLNPDDSDNPINLEGFGSWNVYPSPNDGTFEVEIEMLSKRLPATIVIYDVYGSKILQRDLEGSIEYLESFTLNNVGTGIYNISLLVRDRIFYKNILIVK